MGATGQALTGSNTVEITDGVFQIRKDEAVPRVLLMSTGFAICLLLASVVG